MVLLLAVFAYWVDMTPRRRPIRRKLPGLCFLLLSVLLATLLFVGGASRADVPGQMFARAAAAVAMMVALLFAPRPDRVWPRPILFLFVVAVVLVIVQLVPLPPAIWTALPGRSLLLQAGTAEVQPWRPLSIEPGATVNSLGSLLVPGAVLLLATSLRRPEEERLVAVLLAVILVSALVGLLQLSGSVVTNPLVNDTVGAISGLFANRNHFALFLALGCLFALPWAMRNAARLSWRLPAAFGMMLFFFLLILASGSRAGILTGAIGGAIGLWMVRAELRRVLARLPRRVRMAAAIIIPVGIVAILAVSFALDRAQSVDRALLLAGDEDMRTRALPTVLRMIGTYMPVGAGFGTFDTAFRIHEPFDLLKLTYFNHAHDDVLEIAIEGGIAALALFAAALGWWFVASIRVWRGAPTSQSMQQQLGSAMLLLIGIASFFDYPARTPMIMAMVVLAGTWLARADRVTSR